MENTHSKRGGFSAPPDHECLIEGHYSQLLKWAALLTRGDMAIAEDIVQDLCLHFTVAKPDLSPVSNLNGYLYTCLRNIYLSTLARSSREATQIVSSVDFDSIYFALSAVSSEGVLERQNDLRRICNYLLWRKESSKSASYLIFLFFHGYSRREVAEIACLPISAIYNKLKIARTELKSYIDQSGKLRIASRDVPPEPELQTSPVSSVELFSELRQRILAAKLSECLPEEALLAHYRQPKPKPIECLLLSHVVSCETCMMILNRHFQWPTLEDRDPPLDIGSSEDRRSTNGTGSQGTRLSRLMRLVEKRRDRVHEHRPSTLAIAVNGRITAFHDIQSAFSTLSSRVEQLEDAQFVEVFTEQRVRLALLAIDELPPDGAHIRTQRVKLSDDRWLELNIQIDGQGLQSEVTYFDPALAVTIAEEGEDQDAPLLIFQRDEEAAAIAAVLPERTSTATRLLERLRELVSIPRLAWTAGLAFILCVSVALFFRYDRASLDAQQLLSRSVQIEMSATQGNIEHQVLRVEAAADGKILSQASVDLWKDSDSGRYMRRLYNSQKKLIGADWRGKDGKTGSYIAETDVTDQDRELAASDLWKQDVSSTAFRAVGEHQVQVRRSGDGYEFTSTIDSAEHPHLLSVVLLLDHQLRPTSEILHIRSGSASQEVRLVQLDYVLRPSASVPDSVFDPGELGTKTHEGLGASGAKSPDSLRWPVVTDLRAAQMQISVLYELSKIDADTREPVEVTRTDDGHIRVSGTVESDARRRDIQSNLETLPDHQFLDIQLVSQRDLRLSSVHAGNGVASIYNFTEGSAPADTVLIRYFAAKGLSGDRMNSAVAQFSQDALGHAQRALQNAYALKRLGNSFTVAELTSVSPHSQRQWAEMVSRHASLLENELNALSNQLTPIAPVSGQMSSSEASHIQIDTPAEYSHVADQLLRQVQNLNRSIGNSFASGSSVKSAQDPDSLVISAVRSIPLSSARKMASFANHLGGSADPANRENSSINQRPSGTNQ